MPTVADGGEKAALESIHRLKSTEPPLYLTPSPELSKAARLASEYLFSSISPHAPKSPFTHLLTEGFDAEQIWQQIDLQTQPLLSSLRRHVRNFEKNPEEIEKQFNLDKVGKAEKEREDGGNERNEVVESESEDLDDEDDEEEVDEEDEDGESENEGTENLNGVDDKFFKMKELEALIADEEEKEYGLNEEKKSKRKRDKSADEEESEDEEGDQDDDDEEEDEELELMGLDDDDDDSEGGEYARYEDFFVGKKSVRPRKPKYLSESDDMDMDEYQDADADADADNIKNKQNLSSNEKELAEPHSRLGEMEKENLESMQVEGLSTHEKDLARLHSAIKDMEKANMEPKSWDMQGEVTAVKRPKNSALEVDLDFEHNVRPAPVITEEVTASLEELIQKRILEGRFDDNQKPPTLMAKAPREKNELDENKSKKGLAEIYEDEYAQKTGLVSAALSFSDEQKKEANTLFKNLCLKLDSLSHFHFTPKPVIEDMSIQANVPALAMEEIAPLAVSDAAMLAPEEVFSGKGDIKEETELTKAERKRRRANKKRRFKAATAKKMAMKPQQTPLTNHGDAMRTQKWRNYSQTRFFLAFNSVVSRLSSFDF
ncbi:hypothetical protein CASFOL_001175 [Castilleja foliolosa]|uniref:U3 small nucleolar ribonucleoprotein protein MPP10 n=1 Tax=Castilleja foliolosa TaxID=1961234 RepID=A0ABD3EQD8_9LAMI